MRWVAVRAATKVGTRVARLVVKRAVLRGHTKAATTVEGRA